MGVVSRQLDRVRISHADYQTTLQKMAGPTPIIGKNVDVLVQKIELITADIHFLLISLNHLLKVLRRRKHLPESVNNLPVTKKLEADIAHLRDIYEHWDNTRPAFEGKAQKTKSALRFSTNNPGAEPWKIDLQPFKHFRVADVLDINELQSWISALENEVLPL